MPNMDGSFTVTLFLSYDEGEFNFENLTSEEKITAIFNQLKAKFANDWLLLLELCELAQKNNFSIQTTILKNLNQLKCNKSYTKLIENGLNLYLN